MSRYCFSQCYIFAPNANELLKITEKSLPRYQAELDRLQEENPSIEFTESELCSLGKITDRNPNFLVLETFQLGTPLYLADDIVKQYSDFIIFEQSSGESGWWHFRLLKNDLVIDVFRSNLYFRAGSILSKNDLDIRNSLDLLGNGIVSKTYNDLDLLFREQI